MYSVIQHDFCDPLILLIHTKVGICSKGQFSFFPILWSTGAARYTRMHRVNAVECNDIVSIQYTYCVPPAQAELTLLPEYPTINRRPRLSPAEIPPSQSLLARLQEVPVPDTSAMTLSSQSTGSVKVMRMFQLETSSSNGPTWISPCQFPGPSDSSMTHSSPEQRGAS